MRRDQTEGRGQAAKAAPSSRNGRMKTMAKTPARPQQGSNPSPAQQQDQGTTTPPQQPGQTPPVIRDWASI